MTKQNRSTINHPQNRVLVENHKKSSNFFQSDKILQHYLRNKCTTEGFAYMQNKLEKLGKLAATKMDELSMIADKNGPVLRKRNALGEEINEINFHPAYDSLTKIAVDSEMFRVKWQPELREKFRKELHQLGFASGYLFVMGELGLYCPLCMTDGVARIIDRYANDEDKKNLLPKIATNDANELFTGAMFLTEKAGGSDVGANLVSAEKIEEDYYALNGEKWFCSNANAELILALARTNPAIKGTKGLSIFLIEKTKKDGTVNHRNIVRLKDKIGVRSMASAEIILENTEGKILGEEGNGFAIMTEMINLSRLYNSVSASGVIRRVLVEAYEYLSYRKTFGKTTLEHALVRDKIAELAAIHQANFHFCWRTIQALDAADNGDENAAQLVRILTPMLKKETAIDAVYTCREAMEAIGGIAYIEESIIPKYLRDALVLPIWEGAGNIMTLDALRAAFKSKGLTFLFEEISQISQKTKDEILIQKQAELLTFFAKLQTMESGEMQLNAKYFFEELANLYRVCLLNKNQDEVSSKWIDPAIDYLKQKYFGQHLSNRQTISLATVRDMVAWEF